MLQSKSKKKTRERGRPADYDAKKTPKQAAELCQRGFTDQQIADFFQVSVRTIYRWKATHKEFCQALKVAKDVADDWVERSLYHRAIGYEHDDVDIRAVDKELVMTPIRKYFPPDAASAIFWLKNRRPEQWRDRVEPSKVTLEISYRRDPEAFGRVLEQASEEPGRARALELIERHPPEIRQHLQLVLAGVPDEEVENVYGQAIQSILAASHRAEHEEAPRELLERQKIEPDVVDAGHGFMANLDAETDEERQTLQDALEKVDAHNRKVRARRKS